MRVKPKITDCFPVDLEYRGQGGGGNFHNQLVM